MLLFLVWVAYLAFAFLTFTHKIQFAGFLESAAILAGLFIIIFIWTAFRITKPRKARKAAQQQAVTQRTAAPVRSQPASSSSESKEFTFRVAGTTFENEDGESRQEILRHLRFGDKPYADNPDDLYCTLEETTFECDPAIAVYINSYQVGFVPKANIKRVLGMMERSTFFVSSVHIIGGGTSEDGRKLSYGCEITIEC